MANKYNPFRPDKMAPPGLFAGRLDEIRFIDHCLLQTRDSNPQHFLIEGERGIGKSSLFMLEEHVASGRISTMERRQTMNFIVLGVSLQEQDDYYAIIRKISSALRGQIAHIDKLKSLVLAAWDFISKFEAAGVRYNREPKAPEQSELLAHLQSDLMSVLTAKEDAVDGILLLIDEADKPTGEAGLGSICKLLTEELSRRQCDRLCIGMAGLPGIIQKLAASHESSPRVFKTMQLKPLEREECIQVLRLGLLRAKEKQVDVTVDSAACELIAALSEGYPHFLQEFCYAAYEQDNDNQITVEDVLDSLFNENGAFEQLGRKFFAQFYLTPSSDDYRTVLHAMADKVDDWIERATIIKASGLKETTVDNALRAMKAKNIIVQDENRRGFYRLPTRAFAVWIKGQQQARNTAAAAKADMLAKQLMAGFPAGYEPESG